MQDNLFKEIDKNKQELPKLDKKLKAVEKKKYNFYQYVAMFTMAFCLVLGIILGNVFPACSVSSGLYSDTCGATEFNISLTIIVWFLSFLVCMFIYWMGNVVSLLSAIDSRIKKLK